MAAIISYKHLLDAMLVEGPGEERIAWNDEMTGLSVDGKMVYLKDMKGTVLSLVERLEDMLREDVLLGTSHADLLRKVHGYLDPALKDMNIVDDVSVGKPFYSPLMDGRNELLDHREDFIRAVASPKHADLGFFYSQGNGKLIPNAHVVRNWDKAVSQFVAVSPACLSCSSSIHF